MRLLRLRLRVYCVCVCTFAFAFAFASLLMLSLRVYELLSSFQLRLIAFAFVRKILLAAIRRGALPKSTVSRAGVKAWRSIFGSSENLVHEQWPPVVVPSSIGQIDGF